MTHYAGLDVSIKEMAICVVNGNGEAVWQGKVKIQIESIPAALASHAPELVRAGIEAGPMAVWLFYGLDQVGLPIECIHARRAAAALKLQGNKTVRNDARGLAQLVRLGWYEAVSMKSIATYRVRAIFVARPQIVRMCTGLTNKIRGFAKTFGILIGSGKGRSFYRAVQQALSADPMMRGLFKALLSTLADLRQQ